MNDRNKMQERVSHLSIWEEKENTWENLEFRGLEMIKKGENCLLSPLEAKLSFYIVKVSTIENVFPIEEGSL